MKNAILDVGPSYVDLFAKFITGGGFQLPQDKTNEENLEALSRLLTFLQVTNIYHEEQNEYFAKAKKAYASRTEYIRDKIHDILHLEKLDEKDLSLCKLELRIGCKKVVINDEDLVPDSYRKVTIKMNYEDVPKGWFVNENIKIESSINKTKILEETDENKELVVPGVEVIQSKNLHIKSL